MNTLTETNTDPEDAGHSCTQCGKGFDHHSWLDRHDINPGQAHAHNLDIGSYHDHCCPLPECG